MKIIKSQVLLATAVVFIFMTGCGDESKVESQESAVTLGQALFEDKNFSQNRSMSCATCHSQTFAHIDPRESSQTLGASLGDDNVSIGDRNAPSVGYALFSPDFHFDAAEGLFIGGQFLDGRAKNLKEQAKGPFLNPLEMNMPDVASLIERVKENSDYVRRLKSIYGYNLFDDNEKVFDAIADSIAQFEESAVFSPFDSKFDRFLAGDYQMTDTESRGFAIFSNENNTAGAGRCTLCHTISTHERGHPLLTDFSYDNLGVPTNDALRSVNGQSGSFDFGLYGHSDVNDTTLRGAFKVSSLRNIAVTGPYMHNGVFKNLATVVHFYNTRDVTGALNPETNSTWREGEFHGLRNTDELGNLGLSTQDEADLVAFLKLLTDKRYEDKL